VPLLVMALSVAPTLREYSAENVERRTWNSRIAAWLKV